MRHINPCSHGTILPKITINMLPSRKPTSYLYDEAILTDRSGSRGMAGGRSGCKVIGAVRLVHKRAGDIFQSEGRCINAFDGLRILGACLMAIDCSYYVVMMLA